MMYRSINRKPTAGRSHGARLDALEALLPEPERAPSITVRFWQLTEWAKTQGGAIQARMLEITKDYGTYADEILRILIDASEAGEIQMGETFPRALTGLWHLSAEHQARWDAANQVLERIVGELEALRRAEQDGATR